MNCPEVEERICAALESGVLDADAERHLAECAACRAFRNDVTRQDRELRGAIEPARASAAAVAERAVAAIRREPALSRPRRAMRLFPLAAAAAAGFLAAVFIVPPRERVVERPVEKIVEKVVERPMAGQVEPPVKVPMCRLATATGTVETSRDGERWTPLKAGQGFEMDTWARCAGDARAEMILSDRSVVRLDTGTLAFFGKFRKMRLERGRVFARVESGRANFVVATSDGAARVAGIEEGGDTARTVRLLDVKRIDGEEKKVMETGFEVRVLEGPVGLLAGKEEREVEAGRLALVVDGEIRRVDEMRDPVLETEWVHELLAKSETGREELSSRVNALVTMLGRRDRRGEGALRAMGESCCGPITNWMKTEDAQADDARRREAARILSDLATAASIPEMTALLRDRDADVRVSAAKALQRLTGETFGYDAKYWSGPVDSCTEGAVKWGKWVDESRRK